MPNEFKVNLVSTLMQRFAGLRRLSGSQSLFEIANSRVRLYLRYSKLHGRSQTFYGLRQVDVNRLDGYDAFICFFTDTDAQALFLPYADFDQVLRQSPLATDNQYKVQILFEENTRELYIPRVGRFNVEAYGGVGTIADHLDESHSRTVRQLSHAQVQSLVGGIGHLKGYGVYVPPNNVDGLCCELVRPYPLVERLPANVECLAPFAREIDVIWLGTGREVISALFEVEHSTPVYSGLLRFNDMPRYRTVLYCV